MHIYFESYGCTLNSGEERRMRDTAALSGHTIAREPDEADMIVILTCTVIEPTEHKMKRRIAHFKDYGKQLVVSGCIANVQADIIKDIVPEAVLLPTPGQVERFSEFIQGQPAEVDAKADFDMHQTDVSAAVPIA